MMSAEETLSSLMKIAHLGQITQFSTYAGSFFGRAGSTGASGMNLAISYVIGDGRDFEE